MTRRLAGPPPDPIGRPGRQVERDDPSHRKPPGSRYRGSATAAQEFDLPAIPPKTGSRHELRWGRGDAPSGDGGGRTMNQVLLVDSPPAPDDQGRHARGLGGQLQATRGSQSQARDLADDGSQSLIAQAFLDERQDLPLALCLGIDHPVRMQARAQEPRGEQIPAGQAPEDGSLEPGRDACGEQGGAAGELGGEPGLDHLVEGTPGKATSRQVAIHVLKTEQQGFDLPQPAFVPSNLEP